MLKAYLPMKMEIGFEIKKTTKKESQTRTFLLLKKDDVSEQIANDEELVNYSTSPLILQGLRYEPPRLLSRNLLILRKGQP